jgi:hypothetical protein
MAHGFIFLIVVNKYKQQAKKNYKPNYNTCYNKCGHILLFNNDQWFTGTGCRLSVIYAGAKPAK